MQKKKKVKGDFAQCIFKGRIYVAIKLFLYELLFIW